MRFNKSLRISVHQFMIIFATGRTLCTIYVSVSSIQVMNAFHVSFIFLFFFKLNDNRYTVI